MYDDNKPLDPSLVGLASKVICPGIIFETYTIAISNCYIGFKWFSPSYNKVFEIVEISGDKQMCWAESNKQCH